jgi:hypothetical protein
VKKERKQINANYNRADIETSEEVVTKSKEINKQF